MPSLTLLSYYRPSVKHVLIFATPQTAEPPGECGRMTFAALSWPRVTYSATDQVKRAAQITLVGLDTCDAGRSFTARRNLRMQAGQNLCRSVLCILLSLGALSSPQLYQKPQKFEFRTTMRSLLWNFRVMLVGAGWIAWISWDDLWELQCLINKIFAAGIRVSLDKAVCIFA